MASRKATIVVFAAILVASLAGLAIADDIHPELPIPIEWPIIDGLGVLAVGMSAPADRPGTAVLTIYPGTPVVAAHPGRVIVAEAITGAPDLGLCILIRDAASGVTTRYSNLGSLDRRVGDYVSAGDRIGWVGSQSPNWPEDAIGFDLWIGDIRTNPVWYVVDATSSATGD